MEKKMGKQSTSNIGFEKQIWDAACVLRGNLDASEYKSVVLGLIFLKYISDRFGMVDLNGISRTLSARYYKDGSEILVPQGNGKNPRRLSPRECARLMGYPDKYRLDQVSDVQAYRQCGNSVVVPLITAVSEQIIKTINNYEQHTGLCDTKCTAI